jgi:hypothetical protein
MPPTERKLAAILSADVVQLPRGVPDRTRGGTLGR